MSILPEVDVIYGRKPSYSRDQFVGVARLTADPVVFIVPANSSWKSMTDLIEVARKEPGKISNSTGGNYSGIHLPFELLQQAAGIKMLSVPYKGGGPAMASMLAGEVSMTAQVPGVAFPHVKAGTMRALAHSGAKPLDDFPGVPSLKDLKYDVEFYLWVGLFAPKDVPPDVMNTLRGAVAKAMGSSEMTKFSTGVKTALAYQDADEFNRWWAQDAAKLIQTVRRMGRVE